MATRPAERTPRPRRSRSHRNRDASPGPIARPTHLSNCDTSHLASYDNEENQRANNTDRYCSQHNPGKSQGRPKRTARARSASSKTACPPAFSQRPRPGSPDRTHGAGRSLQPYSCHEQRACRQVLFRRLVWSQASASAVESCALALYERRAPCRPRRSCRFAMVKRDAGQRDHERSKLVAGTPRPRNTRGTRACSSPQRALISAKRSHQEMPANEPICHRNGFNGKEGVAGSSPAEGSRNRATARFSCCGVRRANHFVEEGVAGSSAAEDSGPFWL
jgi:hypothetical protein